VHGRAIPGIAVAVAGHATDWGRWGGVPEAPLLALPLLPVAVLPLPVPAVPPELLPVAATMPLPLMEVPEATPSPVPLVPALALPLAPPVLPPAVGEPLPEVSAPPQFSSVNAPRTRKTRKKQ
jgi:hypothetical protein